MTIIDADLVVLLRSICEACKHREPSEATENWSVGDYLADSLRRAEQTIACKQLAA